MTTTKVKISDKKKVIVDNLTKELLSYPIIGLVKIENINTRVVQAMRSDLRKDAKIIMAKNSFMQKAISAVQKKIPGIENLLKHIQGPCAFLLTKTNPFKLATYMDKNKVPAPAKAGQVAPNDVIILPMNTGMPPGPIISELQAMGLKTRIEEGQIRISEESVVTKEGERVNSSVALLLRRLNIYPFQAGLKFSVALENGEIILGDSLVLDYGVYERNLQWAYSSALNLSVNAGILTKASLPLILSAVYQQALNLSVNAGIHTTKSLPLVLAKALQGAHSVASLISSKDSSALSDKVHESLKQTRQVQQKVEVKETKKVQPEEASEPEKEEDLGLGSLFE